MMFSCQFDSAHEAETDEGEGNGPSDLHAACTFHLPDSLEIVPRPYLHERTDDESGKDNQGLLVPAGEKPAEEFAETEDSDNRSDHEHCKNQGRMPENGSVCSLCTPQRTDIADE